jgi:hypothetical protein
MTDLKSSSGWLGLRKTANASAAPPPPPPPSPPPPRRPLACPRLRGEGKRGRHTVTPVRAELRGPIPQLDRKLMRASWCRWVRRHKGERVEAKAGGRKERTSQASHRNSRREEATTSQAFGRKGEGKERRR